MMQERVQKILARNGIASRRGAEALIAAGRVTVNGRTCALGDTADGEADLLAVDGVPVGPPPERVYILLNKPRGYVTTASDEKGRKTVLDLVDCGVRVYPVGRLDMDSEGLLLLTNDGELANRLIHPAGEVNKTYQVWLSGANEQKLRAMAGPMVIDGYRIRPAQVEVVSLRDGQAQAAVTIHEGRNRQIRKMAEQCGMTVTRLRRVAEGPLRLRELAPGKWRYLTDGELALLRNL